MSQQEDKNQLNVDPNLNPEVAFFINHLAGVPNLYLKVDAKLGGLTYQGEDHYNKELKELVLPHIPQILAHPLISALSQEYQDSFTEDDLGGTCSYSLYDENREAFLQFLKNNEIVTNDFLLNIISTQMII
jgi:hypothetical protein